MLNHQQLLAKLQQFPSPSSYLIAYSGGLDSHVLLHMLATLQDQIQAPLRAMHIQHGLQTEAEEWAAHCLAVCADLKIPCFVKHLHLTPKPGISLEALARDARYAALHDVLPENGMLLTAHHADDQAETLLLQLLRGSGIEGLAAMPEYRAWHPGWHARPLLSFTRTELQAYAKTHNLHWVEDPSNQNTDFDRNYLRQQIMPLLQTRWPAANKTIARSAGHLANLLPLVHMQTENALGQCLNPQGRLLISQLKKQPATEQNLVLRAWIQQNGHPTPQHTHLKQIQKNVLHAAENAMPEVRWNNSIIRRYRDELWILPNKPYPLPTAAIHWPDSTELTLPPGCGRLMRKPVTNNGIPDRLWREGKINVRWRSEGVKCQPVGRVGHRSLKKICQDFAIPPWQRPYLPLIYADDQCIAVADYCVCTGIEILPDDTLSGLIYQY